MEKPDENPSEPAYMTYTVKKGDTLWDISNKFLGAETKWKKIADLNGIEGTLIHIGDVLKIPKQ